MRKNIMAMLGMLMLAACNSVSVHWSYPSAAEGSLPNVGTLGVLPFAGERGQQMSASLAQGLHAAGLYDVIDGSAFESLANSVYLGKRLADMDRDRDDPMGEFLGKTDAVITGRVTSLEVRDRIETHAWTIYDPDELPSDSMRRVTYCTLGVLVEVRRVPGGELIFEREYVDKQEVSTGYYNRVRDIPPTSRSDDNALKSRVIQSVIDQVTNRFTPKLNRVDFQLYSDKKVPGSQEAVALAQAGDWAGALQKFEEIAPRSNPSEQQSKYRARTVYCKGVALAALWRLDEAKAAFTEANNIHAGAEYRNAINTVVHIGRAARRAVEQAREIQSAIDKH